VKQYDCRECGSKYTDKSDAFNCCSEDEDNCRFGLFEEEKEDHDAGTYHYAPEDFPLDES